ncbi:MAG: hypothetical protein ACRD3W_08885, partial [Terriglobales bacterium]
MLLLATITGFVLPLRANADAIRTLNFPASKSMGNLYKLGQFLPDENGYRYFRPPLDKARGAVKVPANIKLRLQLSYEGAEDPAPLLKLDCPALISIDGRNCESVEDKTVQVLSQLKDLEELRLDNTDITDKSFEYIRTLPKLICLDVTRTDLGAQGMEQIKKLAKLKILAIGFNALSDKDFDGIEKLQNIEYIFIARSGISDETLKHIAKLKLLRRIDIADNLKITDKGVEYLTACP